MIVHNPIQAAREGSPRNGVAPSQGKPGEGGLNPKELGFVSRLDISGLDIAALIPSTWLTFHRTSGFDLVARVPGPKPRFGQPGMEPPTGTCSLYLLRGVS